MRKGLSLLETIISTFLFGMVLLLVMNFVPTSTLSLAQGERRTRAGLLAQSQLNEARARPFGTLESTPLYQQDDMSWQLEVRSEKPGRLKALKVTVGWQERGETRRLVGEVWTANVTR